MSARHPQPHDPPTPEQLAILQVLARGALVRDAAASLGIDKPTATRRLSRLYRRLGLTATQTLILAGQKGWVQVNDWRGRS